MSDRDEMREMAVTLCLWAAAAVILAVLIAALSGCQFHFLENGLTGRSVAPDVPSLPVQPPPVQTPGGDSAGQWQWLSDPALWSSVAFGVVYVGNQVRKSRKYRNGAA